MPLPFRMLRPPIDRIPPEILSTIFLYVLPPFEDTESPELIPILLSQVCRRWHAFVLKHPALWASLKIKCSDRLLPPLHTIHTHLLRSAAYPLSIVLETKSPNSDFPAVLAALAAARNRWRYISGTLVSETAQEMIDVIAQGDIPLLQSFRCSIDNHASGVFSIPLHALQRCPQLVSLIWRHAPAPPISALGNGSWPQLTTLELDVTLTISDCLALLRFSPCLSIANFTGIKPPGDVIPLRHLLHPTLRILNVAGEHTTSLISALTLPTLWCLYLHSSTGLVEHHTALSDFLSRSAPPLYVLELLDLHTPEPILLRVLALAMKLHTLSVMEFGPSSVPLTAALIRALHLSPPSSTAPLCPRLRVLKLNNLDTPDGTCAAMLRARWGVEAYHNGVTYLHEAHLSIRGNMNSCDNAEMQSLCVEGLKGSLSVRKD